MGRHTGDDARQEAVEHLGVLDLAAESVLNDAVALAASICERPMAAITVTDNDRQWFLAEVGIGVRQTPLAWSFCRHALAQGPDGLDVADTAEDSRFRANPLVTSGLVPDGPGVRSYAGMPLTSDDSHYAPIGTLCVLGTEPGALTDKQRFALRTLARQVALLLESRRVAAEIAASVAANEAAAERDVENDSSVTAMFNGLDTALVLTGPDGRILRANPAFGAMVGSFSSAVAGTSYLEYIADSTRAAEEVALSDLWHQRRTSAVRELTFFLPDGSELALLATSSLARRGDGTSQTICTRFDDIAAQRQAEVELHEAHSAVDGIVTVDGSQRIVSWNNGAARLLGFERANAVGKHLTIIVPPEDRDAHNHGFQRLTRGGEPRLIGKTVELEALKADGTRIPIELSMSRWYRGDDAFYTAVIRDISERRRHEAKQLWITTHDTTTGLGNLAALRTWYDENCVGDGHAHPTHGEPCCAVFSLQLTSLDTVTAAMGVEVAEHLLGCVGKAFAEANRRDLMICHLGDTHFAGAAVMHGGDDLVPIEERLGSIARYVLDAASGPFTAGGLPIEMHAQVGIAAKTSRDTTFPELLRQAEASRTKTPRRVNIAPKVDISTGKGVHEMRLISEFRSAIESGQLELHYQPLSRLQPQRWSPLTNNADVSAVRPGMVEALVRWRHPDRGIVSPNAFIPLIESGPLVSVLTKWVLDAALRQQAEWRDEGLDIVVAVNLSPQVLLNDDVITLVSKALSNAGVEPTRLKIEITESAIIDDPDEARDVVKSLRGLGVAVSLDDFGTGFTSLSLLRDLPVDEIKLDRLFVAGATMNPADAAVANAVALLAQRLGIRTVAEGIEDNETRSLFRALGYDHMQGFLDSPPLPADRITLWLHDRLAVPEIDEDDRLVS